jgi:uncharacterized protein YccT (UPF0319 family)
MAVDFDALKQQVDAQSGPQPTNSFGMGVLGNALNQPSGSAAASALNGDSDVEGMIKENIQSTKKGAESYKKESDPLFADFDKVAKSPTPVPPKYEDFQSAKDLQKTLTEGKKATQDWAAAVGAISALIGGVAKKHSLAGLAALKGGLEGLNEGNAAQAKQQMDLFDQANKSIKEHNDMLNQQYNDILADRRLSLEDIKQRITEKSLQYGDVTTAERIQSGDLRTYVDFLKKRNDKVEQVSNDAQTVTDSSGKLLDFSSAKGDDVLKFVPEKWQTMVKLIADGDMSFPGPRSPYFSPEDKKSGAPAYVLNMAAKMNPELKQNTFAVKQGVLNDIAHGPWGKSIASINTLDKHLDNLLNTASTLDNASFRPLNAIVNKSSAELGNPKLVAMQADIIPVSSETVKALAGPNGGTREDREQVEQLFGKLNATNSPEQFIAAATQLKEMALQRKGEIYKKAKSGENPQAEIDQGVADAATLKNTPANAPVPPPMAGARQAPDGKFYIPDPARPGKYLQVQ